MLQSRAMINSVSASTAEQAAAPDISAITALTKAAGDPLRMQVLKVLQQNAYGVLELSQIFAIRQSAMSHHLKILANAGLVATRREGTTIFYRRNLRNTDIDLQPLQQALFASIDKAALDDTIREHLQEINKERASASVEFFNRNVSRFEENQDLIASWSDYGDSVESFLDSSLTNTRSALEIGPGYGQFLGKLSSRFGQVTALDNSAEMLERCRNSSKELGLDNISFVLGDTSVALDQQVSSDCVSLNMVQHHQRLSVTVPSFLTPGVCC